MLNRVVQSLSDFANCLGDKISRFVFWLNSERGVRAIHRIYLILRICFILLVYYYAYRFVQLVYTVAATPVDASKFILGLSGVVAFIWALVRINITGGKLLVRLRNAKREKVDIPLRRWLNRTINNAKKTKAAIAYWETLKRLTGWSESITQKFILWPLHSLFEPELETNSLEEFLSANNLSDTLKLQYGEQVYKRYINWGFPISAVWSCLSLIILVPVMSWVTSPFMWLVTFMADYWGQLITSLLNSIISLFWLTIILSVFGSFFIGALRVFSKRVDLWWNRPLSSLPPPEPQQQEYQELKEHLARKMNELMDTTERINKVNKQLRQRKQALARIRALDPELAGSVGVLLDLVLKEERDKAEEAERQKDRKNFGKEIIKDLAIGFIFLILGYLIPSDFVQSLYTKLLMLLPGK